MRDRAKQARRHLGFELHRHTIHSSAGAQLNRLISHLDVDLVLNVGANVGQYALGLRAHGYFGSIVSFEPTLAAHRRLMEAARRGTWWRVAPRMALGSTEGETTINLAGNSVSSSALKMRPELERAALGPSKWNKA